MHGRKCLLPALFLAAITSTGNAAEEDTVRGQIAPQSQNILFASPLLSEPEQADYRARIRAAKDGPERERIRAAHYELMKVRAKERGHALPEIKPAAVGEAGTAFGPKLMTEEERAAQRATLRGAGKAPIGAAARPTDGNPPVKASLPSVPTQAAVLGKPAGEVKTDGGVNAAIPNTPPAKPAESFLGSMALPGIDAIFGPQLMSEEEKAAFRARLRSAKSDGERQAIRAERDEQMRLRAKAKGVTLPQ